MRKLGVLVEDMGASQLTFHLTRELNRWVGDPSRDAVVFPVRLAPRPVPAEFATMDLAEAYLYDAPMVATSLGTAARMLALPGARSRYFYVWDLEWIRMERKQWEVLAGIYASPRLRLIARGEDHRRVISAAWNVDVAGVVPDWDMRALSALVWGEGGFAA